MDVRNSRWAIARSRASWATAALLALTALPSLIPAAASAGGTSQFGISTGGTIQNEDAATLGRDLDAIEAVGAKWIRVDINWAQIQRYGPDSYSWSAIDRVVQGASARGINVLGTIVYSPAWARPAGTTARHAPDAQKYAAFAATAAQHYAAMGVHHYEVWNEPNIASFWAPSPDVAAYTELLKAAHTAIKTVEPEAVVLGGVTSPAATDGTDYSPVDFLRGIYANGGGDSLDAVSHHPYTWPADPGEAESWSAWWQLYGTNPSLRSVMLDHGDGDKQIWGTEFGAPTNGPPGSHVSEGDQARMISRAYELWGSYSWAGPLFTYQARDIGTSTATRENFFGLLRNDYSQKPAYAAYRAAVDSAPVTAVDSAPMTDGGTPNPSADGTTSDRESSSTLMDSDDAMIRGEDDPIFSQVKVTVRGKGVSRGASAQVSGRVRPRRDGKVTVRLYRMHRRAEAWRAVSPIRTSKISGTGRFMRSMRGFGKRKLRRGVYRVRAHYRSSLHAQTATSWSPRFRIRHGARAT